MNYLIPTAVSCQYLAYIHEALSKPPEGKWKEIKKSENNGDMPVVMVGAGVPTEEGARLSPRVSTTCNTLCSVKWPGGMEGTTDGFRSTSLNPSLCLAV